MVAQELPNLLAGVRFLTLPLSSVRVPGMPVSSDGGLNAIVWDRNRNPYVERSNKPDVASRSRPRERSINGDAPGS